MIDAIEDAPELISSLGAERLIFSCREIGRICPVFNTL